MAQLSLTEVQNTIRTLTNPKISKYVSDNITAKIPLLYFLDRMGNKEYEDGGFDYRFPIMQSLSTAQAYTGMTVLTSPEADPVTMAVYSRKQLTVPVVLTGTKLLQNSGNNPESIVNYSTFLVEHAIESMKDSMAGTTNGIMSNNGETDLGITGLQNLVSTSYNSGTTGGLDRSVYSVWQNQYQTCATGFSTNGRTTMDGLFFSCIRGDEHPTIVILTQSTYINLSRNLSATLQYNQPSPKTAYGDIGFEHIYWHGVPCMFDSYVPANTGYMLNLKYLKLLVSRDRDMTFRDFITPTDGDYLLGRIYWAGNLVSNNLARQGVLTGSPDTY